MKVRGEATDPTVFAWYIENYGADVNLFVDHSQIVQLECLRAGIWGTKSLWGRVLTYKSRTEISSARQSDSFAPARSPF
jgi:phosphosulfolactate synthase (CoM biosynthesis protein A)